METQARAQFIRTSPRKMRLVVALVRGLRVDEALSRLQLLNKQASGPVAKLVSSAVANAEHNFELERANLYIKEIKVDEAPTIKRSTPRAHGRATPIRKRNSHLSVILGEIKDSGVKSAKKQALEAPVQIGATPKGEGKSVARKVAPKDTTKKDSGEDKDKEILDPRREGHHEHGRHEGGAKGFTSKMFRRKSG